MWFVFREFKQALGQVMRTLQMPFNKLGQVRRNLRPLAEGVRAGRARAGLTFLHLLSLYKQALVSLFVKHVLTLMRPKLREQPGTPGRVEATKGTWFKASPGTAQGEGPKGRVAQAENGASATKGMEEQRDETGKHTQTRLLAVCGQGNLLAVVRQEHLVKEEERR